MRAPFTQASSKTMARTSNSSTVLRFHPLDASCWHDLERLFGERGACGGCWCMWWRLPRAQFDRGKGAENKNAFRKVVSSGPPPGILAYAGAEPVGWIALAPRSDYPRFERSRVLKPVDEQEVWSVTCFFVAKGYRGQGVAGRLLTEAVRYAKKQGAKIIEGYPVEASKGRLPDPFVYTGLPSTFLRAGFVEVLRRSDSRPIMRYRVR